MTAGTSLPSDFSPLPQVLLAHMSKRFVERSLEYGSLLGPVGSESPIWIEDNPWFVNGGQYIQAPYVKRIPGLTRRDITSTGALTAQKVEGGNNQGVLLNRRSELMKFTDATWIRNMPREQISAELGRQLGELVLDDLLSTAIAALRGMVEAVAEHISDVWVTSGTKQLITPAQIDAGRDLMGDAWSVLTHMLLHSSCNTDLRSDAVGRGYDTVGGATLKGDPNANGFGLKKVIRDDANLAVADAGFDKRLVFLLGRGVLMIGFEKQYMVETDRNLANENKETLWRADGELKLRSNHMSYNDGAGGANPSNSVLADSANWTDGYENHKEFPAVELVLNATAAN
ncbi:MAG: major capsid protein [Planctomycetota bacterium]|nr:major capsid protein [Planctomycetota bacterium]